ncbi:DUF6193 family natural product biosynthesis protein [Kitasatospora sp. NPDC098652]|uniref:DUF6193 family natural product biosynthesis protein n=1 Tax=Kitasatospora sp. NPDC098652 TaxID=3364095 RepID=UPI0037FA6112
MNPDLYPDLASAGSLAAALESAAAELAVDITLAPGRWGDAASAGIAAPVGTVPSGPASRGRRGPLHVSLSTGERCFGVSGWSLGTEMITGWTADLRDVVRAAVAWGSGLSLAELRERFPFLTSSELAEAHEHGVAAVVGLQWSWIRERALQEPEFTGFGLLVAAADAEPRLRQLSPVVSHRTLVLRDRTGFPSDPVIAIAPAQDGCPYRVQRFPHGGVIAEVGTAEEAVALAVAHLPAGLGPAVLGSKEDG